MFSLVFFTEERRKYNFFEIFWPLTADRSSNAELQIKKSMQMSREKMPQDSRNNFFGLEAKKVSTSAGQIKILIEQHSKNPSKLRNSWICIPIMDNFHSQNEFFSRNVQKNIQLFIGRKKMESTEMTFTFEHLPEKVLPFKMWKEIFSLHSKTSCITRVCSK